MFQAIGKGDRGVRFGKATGMTRQSIPWGWLALSFIGYGVIGFSIATIAALYFLPITHLLLACFTLTALLVLILTFSPAIGAGLIVGCTIAFSAAFILRVAYFWNFILYFWSDSARRIWYLVVLGVALGTVWSGVAALIGARNELIEGVRKLHAFLVLVIVTLLGLGVGWAIGWWVQR